MKPQSLPKVSVPSTRARQRLCSRDWPRPPRRDPHARIIAQLAQLAGPDVTIIASSSRPWASATFTGAQHRIVLKFSGDDAHTNATRLAELLPETEFTISGHIVADATVDEWHCKAEDVGADSSTSAQQIAGDLLLRVIVLTVEDW